MSSIIEKFEPGKAVVTGLSDFDITQVFDCGQCFRFDPDPEGGISGIAFGRRVRFEQPQADTLVIHGASRDDYERIWKRYLALDEDYGAIKADIAEKFTPFDKAGIICAAMERGGGIRVLRQEPWETLCSFIVSQNNNMPRIKKIIAALSEAYGEKFECKTEAGERIVCSAFPTPEALAEAGEQAIYALRTGFRAKYIFDAARRVAEGEIDLEAVAKLPTSEAAAELMKIKGVGIKVASCVLLFGFGRTEVFPVDVWVRRVLEKYYPDSLDISALGRYAGIAQQYLFYYERYTAGGTR
ncbi:MAG: DNA-3-methyladenine glycosylase 2 family protein [Clostridiales bacterium]|jgi:N-glycosylase/DNA lyase|nr:DNA-3-methyladenine glycosylase 2 family protein [Clostridiales bacterium]